MWLRGEAEVAKWKSKQRTDAAHGQFSLIQQLLNWLIGIDHISYTRVLLYMQDIGKVRTSLQNFMVHSDIEASLKICGQEIEKKHKHKTKTCYYILLILLHFIWSFI